MREGSSFVALLRLLRLLRRRWEVEMMRSNGSEPSPDIREAAFGRTPRPSIQWALGARLRLRWAPALFAAGSCGTQTHPVAGTSVYRTKGFPRSSEAEGLRLCCRRHISRTSNGSAAQEPAELCRWHGGSSAQRQRMHKLVQIWTTAADSSAPDLEDRAT